MATPDELLPRAEAGDGDALAALLQLPADATLLARFAASSVGALQSRAAAHEATPAPALRTLAGVRDLRLRTELLDRTDLDEAALLALAESDALFPRILARPDCPLSLLEDAASSNEPLIQRLVAIHPRTPSAALDDLTRRTSDAQVEELLWERVEADPERLPSFAHALSPELRTRFAQHPLADPELVQRLARDRDDDVRAAVAGRSDLAPELVRELASDGARDVARVARSHPVWRRRRRMRGLSLAGAALLGLACAGVLSATIGGLWWTANAP
jgi:hypothetical protein